MSDGKTEVTAEELALREQVKLTKAQKRHKARAKARTNHNQSTQEWRHHFSLVIDELKKQQTAAIREHCHNCYYEHGLLKDPCVEHLPTLTDVDCMVIGYCQNSGCHRCLIEWRAGIDCCDENTKCRCLELFPRKNRTLIERRRGGIKWIMDKGRKPIHLWQDIRTLDEVSNGWASRRISLTTGAFVNTEYGYDEIGIGLSGYEDPDYIPPYWKDEFIRYAFWMVIRRKPVRDLFQDEML